MKNDKIVGLIVGGFILFLFLIYGIFSELIGFFIQGFGPFFGLILGLLFVLMIITAFLRGGRKR